MIIFHTIDLIKVLFMAMVERHYSKMN